MNIVVVTSPFPFQSMSANDGDVILVRLPEQMITPDYAQQVMEVLSHRFRMQGVNVQIVVCTEDFRIEALSEAEMAKHGWVRNQ